MSLTQIKELRSRTGCGIVDCRAALAETSNDVEQAILLLRKKGIVKAAKKAGRVTKEGYIASYLHGNGKLGVLVALNCETDFVAKTDRFRQLAVNLAMHVAAMEPVAVSPEELPASALEEEETIAREQAAASGKPAAIQEKMVAGKLKKFREERALLTQAYVKDPDQTVQDLIKETIAELGENITVGGFSRLAV